MAAGGIRFKVQPRLAPAAVAARRLGLSVDDFRAKVGELRLIGFPAPCSVTGNFDLVAIDAWLDRRAGLALRTLSSEAAAISDRLSTFDG
jgi:hypothetical protein